MEKVEIDQKLELELLLEKLKTEGETRRRSIRFMVGFMGSIGGIWLLLILATFLKTGEIDLTSFLSQLGLIGCFTSAWGLTQSHQNALKEAQKWKDPLLVPHLLEVMDSDSADIRLAVRSGLSHLLQRLEPRHAEHFTPHQIKLLEKVARGKDAPLAEKAVKALAVVGNKGSLIELDALVKSGGGASKEEAKKRSTLALQAAGDLRIKLAKHVIDAKSVKVGIDLHENSNRN
jgi:hypothetical protein